VENFNKYDAEETRRRLEEARKSGKKEGPRYEEKGRSVSEKIRKRI